ncbi:hypothetical protein CVT26_013776 [Gymnopilus dilepis]|uniref:F-box domain-containing protein n=1 Tax=Gymnopilus dilepis TaxID=231916 RepID=A0A409Y6K9_9AGAR|nr:hypothetical protein CVT26_013776 [Gymnopilus dilepis]
MGNRSISEFPAEIHTIILTYLCTTLALERKRTQESLHAHAKPIIFSRYDADCPLPEDVSSPALFPYNIVSVCKLWRDLLIQIPEAWTRIVFDVAHSPTPYLDSFLWSKDLTDLEVVIFNSADIAGLRAYQSETDDILIREWKNVLAIQQAFLPHVSRCKSIIYNLNFASSLPAPDVFLAQPMPHLKVLRLDCKSDDLTLSRVLSGLQTKPSFAVSFPKLELLSLTGIWFMDTVRLAGEEWITQLQVSNTSTLRISDFTFPEDGIYSLDTFMDYLSRMSSKFPILYLHNMSLNFPYTESTSNTEVHRFGPGLHFQSVSTDFLSRFDLLCGRDILLCDLTFQDCQVPVTYNFSAPGSLVLDGIRDSADGASVRNAINCEGSVIWVSNCPTFDDGVLQWLAKPDRTGVPGTIIEEDDIPDSDLYPAPGLKVLCKLVYRKL